MKYIEISKLIERRVQRGDYLLNDLPGERELATEQGVSHMTARHAVQHLIQEEVLVRKPNGRVAVNAEKFGLYRQMQVAILTPAFPSPTYDRWRYAMDLVCRERGTSLRMVPYVHWDDPAIFEAIERFDTIFMLVTSDPLPAWVAERLRNAPHPVVALDADLTQIGVYSLCSLPARLITPLLDHLRDQGYRRVDCVNTQPESTEMAQRIQLWQEWRDANGVDGELLNEPVRPYESPLPHAYQVIRDRLATEKYPVGTALFCTINDTAVGAIRALYESGSVIGREIGVCSVNDVGHAQFTIPSLTSVGLCDPAFLIRDCLDEIERVGTTGLTAQRREADTAPLFIGESTAGIP